MTHLVFQAGLVALAAIVVGLVRCLWGVTIMHLLEKQCQLRRAETQRLESEIVLARLKCATANPEASAILSEWEAARKHHMGFDDRVIYSRFFDRCMGGQSRAEVISHQEAEETT